MDEGVNGLVLLVGYTLVCTVGARYLFPRLPFGLISFIGASGSTVVFLVTVGILEGFSPFILMAAGGAWIWSFLVAIVGFVAFRWVRRRASSAGGKGDAT